MRRGQNQHQEYVSSHNADDNAANWMRLDRVLRTNWMRKADVPKTGKTHVQLGACLCVLSTSLAPIQ